MNLSDAELLREANSALTEGAAASVQSSPEWWSTTNAMTMCGVVLVFGLIVLCLCAFLLKAGKPAHSVLRVIGTVLVILMATFLVVAGYDDKQIAAPLGLLGTIAGYLLGREGDNRPHEPRD